MTTRFTPGPWTATQNEIDELIGEWTIRDSDGGYVADVRNPYCDYDMQVAHAEDPKCRIPHDAHLIAAAPELFEALAEILAALREYDDADYPARIRRVAAAEAKADAALTRARGGNHD